MRPLALPIILLLALAACGDDSTSEPSPTASATRTPTPTSSASPDPQTISIHPGPPAELPADLALIVETGCWQCDGGPSSFVRVLHSPGGEITSETLFSPGMLGLTRSVQKDGVTLQEEAYIYGQAFREDASEMVVEVCVAEWCGGVDPPTENSAKKLFRSTDGGVTWNEWGSLPVGDFMIGFAEDSLLVAHREATSATKPPDASAAAAATPATPLFSYYMYPDGSPVSPPPGEPLATPVLTSFTAPFWLTPDARLLSPNGTEVLAIPHSENELVYVLALTGDFGIADGVPIKGSIVLQWGATTTRGGNVSRHLGIFDLLSFEDGRTGIQPVRLMEYEHYLHFAGLQPGTKGSFALVNTEAPVLLPVSPSPITLLSPVPGLLNMETGEVSSILQPFVDPGIDSPFLGPDGTHYPQARNLIDAAQTGPFARVTNTGSCLNIRANPGVSAETLECAADNVLLHDTGETAEADGQTWLRVVTPAHTQGWASTEFLER